LLPRDLTDPDTIAQLLDAVKQSIIVTTPDGVITHWNQSAEELFGWTRDEVLGHLITEVTPAPATVEQALDIMNTLRSGESWGGRFTVRHRTGREFDVMVIDSPLMRDGQLTGIVGVAIPMPGGDTPAAVEQLSPREREIARLTSEGMTSSAIGAALGISTRTVETHRANVYRKLGIRSRTELIVYAIRNGLLLGNSSI
jgi:PAS domain S-box-containing protein